MPLLSETRTRIVSWRIAFAVLLAGVLGYAFVDRPLAVWCSGLPATSDDVLEVVTYLGNSTWSLIGSGVAFIVLAWIVRRPRWRNAAGFVFVSVAASGILVLVVKTVFARLRPVAFLEKGDYGFTFWKFGYRWASFPSGHADTAFALALALALVWPRTRRVVFALAVLVALTRVVLDHHYLSDVIVGGYLGLVTTVLLARWFHRRGWDH